MRNFYCLILLVLIAALSTAQSQNISGVSPKENSCGAASAKIMILGTYHMANPGLDGRNLEADDVLLPRRQREIAELLEKLARFNPTKIEMVKFFSTQNSLYSSFV